MQNKDKRKLIQQNTIPGRQMKKKIFHIKKTKVTTTSNNKNPWGKKVEKVAEIFPSTLSKSLIVF